LETAVDIIENSTIEIEDTNNKIGPILGDDEYDTPNPDPDKLLMPAYMNIASPLSSKPITILVMLAVLTNPIFLDKTPAKANPATIAAPMITAIPTPELSPKMVNPLSLCCMVYPYASTLLLAVIIGKNTLTILAIAVTISTIDGHNLTLHTSLFLILSIPLLWVRLC
jgi:hypothetical protein